MKYKVFVALSEDINSGWVWIGNPPFEQRSIVKVRNLTLDKTIYTEVLHIDPNFVKRYNKQVETLKIHDPSTAIVVNEWYRWKLGNIKSQEEVELEVISSNNIWGRLCANLCYHPQVVVRLGSSLGLVSVLLGIISIILTLILPK